MGLGGVCGVNSCSLTFLATLFVLLFICSAIILRSFLQRRRLRRQIEAQIAAGLLPPEAALQRLRRHYQYDYGEKPKLWDCYITPAPDPEHARKRWDELEVRPRFLPCFMCFLTSDIASCGSPFFKRRRKQAHLRPATYTHR